MIMEGKENKDKERIVDTIMTYVKGVQEFDFDKAESSWHPEGIKLFYDSDSGALKTQTLIQSRPSSPPSKKISQTAEIMDVDLFETAARVTLKWIMKTESIYRIYIDYISLYRINGEWKIVSKISGIKDEKKR